MKKCKHCKETIDLKELKRVYGEESSVYLGGFCTARCYTLHETKIIGPTGLKAVLGKLSVMTIPENALLDRVVKELQDREAFKDADANHNERIYHGDVFGQILGEQERLKESGIDRFTLDKKTLNQLEELNELVDADYIMVTLT